MKLIYLVLFCILQTLGLCAENKDTTRVLFVGNSYTYGNNLYQLFTDLSTAAGKQIISKMVAFGGYTLQEHSVNSTTLTEIQSNPWHFVILQEQSQYPVIEYYRYRSMYPSAAKLDSLIKQVGAKTLLFMTWGRKNGGIQTIGSYSSPDFPDFFAMQDSMASSYRMLGRIIGAEVAEVGEAWRSARMLQPEIDLWTSDNSHPNLIGSYLAACVFYLKIFKESPLGIPYYGGLSEADALFLQTIVNSTSIKPEITKDQYLLNAYPNPFNNSITVSFNNCKKNGDRLSIYDVQGRKIMSKELNFNGISSIPFDFTGNAAGLYFIAYEKNNKILEMMKIVLQK